MTRGLGAVRVGDALGVGLPALVEADTVPLSQVTRAGGGVEPWHGAAGGSAVLTVGTHPPNVLELWEWQLGPGDAMSFRGDVAHSYGCAGTASQPTRFILSVFEPGVDPDTRR